MGWKANQLSQQSRTRGTRKLLGLGLVLFVATPLAGCQSLSYSLAAWERSQANVIEEAQAAVTEESPEAITHAMERLTEAIAAATESANDWGGLHYERAYYHHIRDDFEAAIADYNIAVAAYGDRNSQLYLDRGLAQESFGNGEAAIADYTKAIAINEGWADEAEALALSYTRRGEVYESLANVDAALADYNTAIALTPSLARAFYNRAYLNQSQDNLNQAIQDFTRYIQLTEKPDSWAYYSRGLAYEAYDRSSQALADYSEAIALNDWGNGDPELDRQDQADAYFARAWLHHDLGNHRRAIQNYSESLKLNPIDSLALYNRGLAHNANGNLDQVLADYTRAIEINKNWGTIDPEGSYLGLDSALYNRGLIYESQGKAALAQQDFQSSAMEKPAL